MVARLEGSTETKVRIGRAFRLTMAWQIVASVAIAALAGVVAGVHGLLSALLGGGIGVIGVLVFSLISHRGVGSSSSAVRVALRAEGVKVLFDLSDYHKNVTVQYEGILPDLFREGQGIVALGRLGTDGVFVAEEVLAKHDENYMPPEVNDAVMKGQALKQAADAK